MDWIVQTRAADGPWVRGMGTPRSDGPHEPYHCRAGGPDKRERRGLLVATHRNEILVPNRNASIAFGSCTKERIAEYRPMNLPDWTTLRIFLAAIECGSVTRASEKCG